MRSIPLERLEPLTPIGPEFGSHPPTHKGPSHRGCIRLQLFKLRDVFVRQGIRDGRHQLRHLHQRAFEPAEGRCQLTRMLLLVEIETEITRPNKLCGQSTNRAADTRISFGAAADRVVVGIAHDRIDNPRLTNGPVYRDPYRSPDRGRQPSLPSLSP